MFLHVAHWNILAAGKLVTRQVLLPTQRRASLQPRFGGAWVVAARATLRVVEKLNDTKTGVSSSLHSLNIEFGAARVAALPRATWSSGCSWPTTPGATALLLPLLI
jgi:hypothetical protein